MPTDADQHERLTRQELEFVMNMPRSNKRYTGDRLYAATRAQLTHMTTDVRYNTNPGSAHDGKTVFIEKHVSYLENHPYVNPLHYISNLKLMTRKRT